MGLWEAGEPLRLGQLEAGWGWGDEKSLQAEVKSQDLPGGEGAAHRGGKQWERVAICRELFHLR